MSRSAMSSTLPPRLRPGDAVRVVAPAGPVPRETFEEGLRILEARYRVVYDEGLFARQGFLAGSDERRIDELHRAFSDPDARAVICARGGYGLTRILDRLDPTPLRRDPKIVLGFSDATALLAWCQAAAGLRTVHGPMPVQLARLPEADVTWLFRLLEDASPPGAVPATLAPLGVPGGAVSGPLTGGNLEIATRLLATPWELPLGGAVLFFEDVGERPYRVDRMLTQLGASGRLSKVAGVLVGDLVRCEEPGGEGPGPLDVVAERLAAFGVPAAVGLPVGHGDRNLALPLGARATWTAGDGALVLEEPAVAR